MQSIYRSLLVFLFFTCTIQWTQVSAQEQMGPNIYQRMTINRIESNQEVTRLEMMEEEVSEFNVTKFLEKYHGQAEIQLRGTIMSEHMVTKLRFDTKDIPTDQDCAFYCQKVEKVEKLPFLGVATVNNETFDGITINKIISNTAAENAQLQMGDIITFIDEEEIRSGCDLRSLISTYEVGDLVEVQFIRNQRSQNVTTTLGYRLIKEITWTTCCDQVNTDLALGATLNDHQAQLELFPNPNNGFAQMQYQSTQKGGLTISITDVSGREIYRNEILQFNGFYNEHLDISRQAEGIYFLHVVQADQVQTKKMVVHKEF